MSGLLCFILHTGIELFPGNLSPSCDVPPSNPPPPKNSQGQTPKVWNNYSNYYLKCSILQVRPTWSLRLNRNSGMCMWPQTVESRGKTTQNLRLGWATNFQSKCQVWSCHSTQKEFTHKGQKMVPRGKETGCSWHLSQNCGCIYRPPPQQDFLA